MYGMRIVSVRHMRERLHEGQRKSDEMSEFCEVLGGQKVHEYIPTLAPLTVCIPSAGAFNTSLLFGLWLKPPYGRLPGFKTFRGKLLKKYKRQCVRSRSALVLSRRPGAIPAAHYTPR